jgi:hypothetical protein
LRVVLAYNNASIRGHVNVTGGKLPDGEDISISVYHPRANGGGWSTEVQIDGDGNAFLHGLEPGQYQLSIRRGQMDLSRTERKIIVEKNKETRVTFDLQL